MAWNPNNPQQPQWPPQQRQPQPYAGQWPPPPGQQPYPQDPRYPPPPGQQPYPRQAPPPKPAPRKRGSARAGCGILLALAVVIAIVIGVLASQGGGGGSFRATVADYVVINPADLAVTIHVTNTGGSAATPTCTVDAQDPSGAYSGVDVGTLSSPVQAGQATTYVDNVTITHEGAQYVTQVTVSC